MIKRLATGGFRLLLAVALIGWILHPSCSKKKPTSVNEYPLTSAPTLYSPLNGATKEAINTALRWTYEGGYPKGYTVQISTDSTFAHPTVNKNTSSESCFSPELNPHTKFFWRVRAYSTSYVSNWSEIRSFTTGPGKVVGSLETMGTARSIAVQNSFAYLVSDSGMQVIDVSNPAAPKIVGTYREIIYSNRAITVAGNYSYIATFNGMVIVNISSPSAPMLTGRFQNSRVWDLAVSGNYAYLVIDRNSSNSRMVIVDISSPSSPKLVKTWNVKPDTCWKGPCYNSFEGIAVAGNYAHLAASYGLEIVDITNPEACSLAGRYSELYPYDVAIMNTYAYLYTSYPYIKIIDVSNPTGPKYLGSYIAKFGGAQSISISGQRALLVGQHAVTSEPGYSLEILDLSNPAAPASVAAYNGVEGATGIDSLVYVAAGRNGFKILQFSP